MPASSSTPYFSEIFLSRSATSGYWIGPMPPWFRGVFFHARCVKCESTETPMTSVFFALNFATALSKAMISDGQTKVKSSG